MSNLSVIELLQENSQATPGLWNQRFSVISANLAALNSDITLSLPTDSGDTFSLLSHLTVGGRVSVKERLHVGVVPSASTLAQVVIGVDSSVSDYLLFADTSGANSSYLLGSRVGPVGDGLNLYDVSGDTMIVSFSKQSVRFYQTVIGPLVDSGGAVFNVKSYGAKGDGSTDDTGSIRLAEADAEVSGGEVLFPPGTYSITSTIRISASSVRWTSVGGATIRAAANMNGDMIYTVGTDATPLRDLEFNNITFDGNQTNQGSLPTTVVNLRLDHTERVNIYNCTFLNGYYAVINFSHSREALVLGNTFKGFRATGILASWRTSTGDTSTNTSRDFVVEGNFINADHQQTTAGNGIFFAQYADSSAPGPSFDTQHAILNCDVVGNTVLGCNDTGIEFSIGMMNGSITGNVIDGSGQTLIGGAASSSGILINDCVAVSCYGNTIRNYASGSTWTQDGIVVFNRGLGAASLFPRNIAVVGNTIVDVPRYGVRVSGDVTDVLVSGNVSTSIGSAAVSWANSGNTNNYFGFNWFSTGTPMGPSLGTMHTLGFINESVTVFTTGSNAVSGMALRTVAGSPPAMEVLSGNLSAYTNLRAAALYAANAGTAVLPAYSMSEVSLGWYRSAASTMALSYGTVSFPGNVQLANAVDKVMFSATAAMRGASGTPAAIEAITADGGAYYPLRGSALYAGNDGTAILPAVSMSEVSLGLYRSGASTMALSYGSFLLNGAGNLVVPTGGKFQFGIGGVGTGGLRIGGSPNAVETILADASDYTWFRARGFYVGTAGVNPALHLNQGRTISMRTLAASAVTASAANTNVAADEIVFTVGGASGASLAIHSGGTVYIFDSVSSARAT